MINNILKKHRIALTFSSSSPNRIYRAKSKREQPDTKVNQYPKCEFPWVCVINQQ